MKNFTEYMSESFNLDEASGVKHVFTLPLKSFDTSMDFQDACDALQALVNSKAMLNWAKESNDSAVSDFKKVKKSVMDFVDSVHEAN